MVRLILVLAGLLACGPASADESADGARLWVEIAAGERAPYPQEMVLLRVRGLFTVPIALEKLEQPALPGFRWLPIGGDIWSATTQDGRPARGFERTLALFAQNSGELTIPAFVHRLTILDPSGARREIAVASEPRTLAVAPVPPPNTGWWLPARAVTLTESWSVAPELLAIGQSTRRTITIEAAGVADDQLPPMPDLGAPKLLAFPAPAERRTVIAVSLDARTAEQKRQALRRPGRLELISGTDGPRARVSYSWDIRPTTDEPVQLPAVEIAWFDTASSTRQIARLPERIVAVDLAGPALAAMEAELGIPQASPRTGPLLADMALVLLGALGGFAAAWGLKLGVSRAARTAGIGEG
ncbi:MAG TPA: hypothetical protein VLA00_16310 [Xanthobacteraceae bacterium]|nr:hypothetical protein [Xanthobacteraceae bacterium]